MVAVGTVAINNNPKRPRPPTRAFSLSSDVFAGYNVSMTAAVARLLDQAEALEPSERYELVQAILCSLSPTDTHVDDAWRVEAESRLTAWRNGGLKDEPIEDVLDRLNRGRE